MIMTVVITKRCIKCILMDEEAPNLSNGPCCKNNRKVFTVLIVTTGLFFILWTYSVNYNNNSMIGDVSFLKTYFFANNMDANLTNTSERTTSLPVSIPVNSQKTTSSGSSIVNPHDFKYNILESGMCDSKNGSVYLMVVVCVAPVNFKERKTIRETWGSVAKTNREMRLVFMLGKTLNDQIQNHINNESNKYHDIIQEDFLDSYRNLSIKSAAMLKWSFTHCPSAKYVLKADDDMFVNLEYLLGVLKSKHFINSVMGSKFVGAKPVQDKNSKWYTPREMFNGNVYPPYVSGTSYVMSGDIIEKLYNTTLVTPFFWLEDIYITGICRSNAKIGILDDYGFTYTKPGASGCTFRKRITGHQYTESEIRKIWKEFIDKSLKCV